LPKHRPPSVQQLWSYLVDEYDYRGSYKSVRKFARSHFPAPARRPFRRIETPAAAQVQSDWLETNVRLRDSAGRVSQVKRYGFVMTLSHSRKTAIIWSESMNQLAWHHVHNEAFQRLGGIAAVNRIDNLKTGVASGSGVWGEINSAYAAYARTMGFHVDPHAARQPQQKGKVERRVGAFKQLDWNRVFDSLADLQVYTDETLRRDSVIRHCPVTSVL
jgi:transposase